MVARLAPLPPFVRPPAPLLVATGLDETLILGVGHGVACDLVGIGQLDLLQLLAAVVAIPERPRLDRAPVGRLVWSRQARGVQAAQQERRVDPLAGAQMAAF